MSEHVEVDVAIVGGGIIGFWTAYEILLKNPRLQVVVFEKEAYFGDHTTGRNSEVLHAGIYYETNSLKHRHCLNGNLLWRDFCKKFDVPLRDCGKFIIATESQKEALSKLHQKSLQNSVPGIRYANPNEVANLKNYLHVDEALYSPTSGVLDVSQSLKRLKAEIETLGGIVLNKNKVELKEILPSGFLLSAGSETIQCHSLINCAGLQAVDFRKQLNLHDYSNYYVKGSYLTLSSPYPAQNLIYPIPPAHGLGLGVHLTLDIAGKVKFGPNTEEVSSIDYSINPKLKESLFPEIEKIFKTVRSEHLHLGYSGIRPKVKKEGELKKDFILQDETHHKIPGYLEFLGIESPGLTAAPSLAKLIASNYF